MHVECNKTVKKNYQISAQNEHKKHNNKNNNH